MITTAECPTCGKTVLFDSAPMHARHPDSTKYYKVENHKITKFYCDALCSLQDYEKTRNSPSEEDPKSPE